MATGGGTVESAATGRGSVAPAVVATPMQILGALEAFDPSTDTVSAYVELAELFFAVNNIAAEKKVPVFLNTVGKQQCQLISNLFVPDTPVSKTLPEIVDVLKGHYEPKPIVISERFNFHRRQQGKLETVAQYVAELRKLSVHCQFGGYLDEALRDRFVCGLRSEAVQKKLLTKEDLTFQEAIRVAQASEQAVAKARQLQSHGSAAPEAPLGVGRLSTPRSGGGTDHCHRCGKADHAAAACKFKTARCHNCNKTGHIAAVCQRSHRTLSSGGGSSMAAVESGL